MAETNSAVKFYRTTSSAFSSATKEDGALYFLTDVGKIYLVVGTGSSQSLYQMSVSPSDIVSNVAQGDGNGQIKVTKNGSASNVSVKGLKSAAYTESTDYATSGHTHDARYVRFDTNSQGLTSTQKSNARTNIGAGTSSFSGSYNDLTNKPTIPAAQVNSDWNASSGVAQILNKPTLASVATSGSYGDLSNKPSIPSKDSDLSTNDRYVRFDTNSQGLSSTQKSNARTNIGAGTSSFSGSYNDLSNKPSIPSKDSDLSTNDRYVRFDTNSQGLSSTQKSNARTNIGAGTSSFSGSYNDLTNKPTIPAAQVNSDWNASSGVAQILNKPTIPTVNNSTITVKQTGIADQTFTLNGSATTITLVDTNTWRPVGTGSTDAAAGNHGHGNINNAGTITSTAVTSATGVLVYDSSNKIQRATAASTRSIIGAGTYSKPSGGIPATDLATGLISGSGSITVTQDNTTKKYTISGSSGGSTLYRHNLEWVFKTGSSSSGYIYTHFYAYLITNSSTAYTYSTYFNNINTLFKKTVLCGGLYDYSSQEDYGYDGISTEWQPNYSKSGNLNGVYVRYMREGSSTWDTSTYINSSTIAYSFTDTVETLN